jgi:hyperosmotically inducible protein
MITHNTEKIMRLSETRPAYRALLTAVAAALAVSVAACGEKQPSDKMSQIPPSGDTASSKMERAADSAEQKLEKAADAAERKLDQAGKAIDDAAVTAKVKSALIAEPNLKALSINVDTMAGIVTLKGTADSQESKQKAEQLASTVEGVRSVKNELVVIRSS